MNIETPPGMTVTVTKDESYLIKVEMKVPDANTGEEVTIHAKTAIHSSVSGDELRFHIIDQVKSLWNHELAEWFKIDGEYVCQPH